MCDGPCEDVRKSRIWKGCWLIDIFLKTFEGWAFVDKLHSLSFTLKLCSDVYVYHLFAVVKLLISVDFAVSFKFVNSYHSYVAGLFINDIVKVWIHIFMAFSLYWHLLYDRKFQKYGFFFIIHFHHIVEWLSDFWWQQFDNWQFDNWLFGNKEKAIWGHLSWCSKGLKFILPFFDIDLIFANNQHLCGRHTAKNLKNDAHFFLFLSTFWCINWAYARSFLLEIPLFYSNDVVLGQNDARMCVNLRSLCRFGGRFFIF